jgi:hypothetical protein
VIEFKREQIPHPLKKRGFGMTRLGGWSTSVARSDENAYSLFDVVWLQAQMKIRHPARA